MNVTGINEGFALEQARHGLADAAGYLRKAATLVVVSDPGFAADLTRAAARAEAGAGDTLARHTSCARTTAEKCADATRTWIAMRARRFLNGGRDGR